MNNYEKSMQKRMWKIDRKSDAKMMTNGAEMEPTSIKKTIKKRSRQIYVKTDGKWRPRGSQNTGVGRPF